MIKDSEHCQLENMCLVCVLHSEMQVVPAISSLHRAAPNISTKKDECPYWWS